MTIEEIRELKEMGFSKDEILAFIKTPEAKETPEKNEEKEVKTENEPETQVDKIAKAFNSSFDGFIEKLNTTIDRMNIMNSQMPEEVTKGAEELLSELVVPGIDDKKKKGTK